ncbi:MULTISPECIES: F0F1 ATP synthase subunit epsilon [Chelativorans]|jgi:F-type H+-transporting ATPase subunit epsilon|uniref:ATP synthase epsilon chain n=1 Tax=Chelativorans sp. (strain BNC1) TaxID=266779 RepID=ATPE_CHESB|nr:MULTISPECIES: F0F1 ATP synthase subunit epsilon [Chelativorans]Q11DD4.1 RecName: Full=ATP synthase epsilon chain; AltName: Full=ATP synthase F1 sector epsilon subunit; AltName: Full=F-ATPase epsilon subunit [Chelativorans sp. BNC1]
MAKTFTFELVSPERLLLSEEVEQVVIPGTEGEMTVMAEHAPVMTGIKPGVITVVRAGSEREQFVVFGGFADITPDGCRLLAESATRVKELDRADLARRIEEVRAEVQGARDHETRTKAEEFLGQLTTLEGALLPA